METSNFKGEEMLMSDQSPDNARVTEGDAMKKSGPIVNIQSEYSKMNLTDQAEVLSDNRTAHKRGKKLVSGTFHFRRQTERASPRTGNNSAMTHAKQYTNSILNTARLARRKQSVGIPEPGTLFYLGHNGDATALQTDMYSARSMSRRQRDGRKANNRRAIKQQ